MTPTAKVRLAAKYPHTDIDWKGVYSLAFRTTLESKPREFQFKIVLSSQKRNCRFGMADSPTCAFCQTDVESLEHLLFSFKVSSKFWKHVLSCLRHYNIFVENIREEDVIFSTVSLILQITFSCFIIVCFWLSFIFTLRNARMFYLLFRVLLPGQSVFITLNYILPGKETN